MVIEKPKLTEFRFRRIAEIGDRVCKVAIDPLRV